MKPASRLFFSTTLIVGCIVRLILREASAEPSRSVRDFEEQRHVILIIDASASMGRLTSGVSHLSAVKDALVSLQQQGSIPASAEVWSFGARLDQSDKEKSCQDIELFTLGENEGKEGSGAWRAHVAALEPRGYSSIAFALDRAAKVTKRAQARIILITDGEERCGGDPLEVIKNIRSTSRDTVLHIVGLSLDFETKQSLLTLAAAGGGKLYQPKEITDVSSSILDAMNAE